MVFEHRRDRTPRFSYSRDSRPNGVFSYSPAFWGNPHAPRERAAAAKTQGFLQGEDAGKKQAMMFGGVALGVVAVGALIYIAAKK